MARLLLVLLALAPALFAGCGPVEYVNQVTRKASTELASAKSVDAKKWAPYHYTRAVEYLRKAREEASRSDYQAANRFGRKSHESAKKARELAIARAKKGELPGPPPLPKSDRDDTGEIEDAPEAGGS